jgi:hypothetical protein
VFEKAADYAPVSGDRDLVKNSDVPWLDRFAAAGGHAIISGDVKMRERAHERLALYHHGFVVIFFAPQWAQWNFFRKSSLMLHWWETIVHKIKTAENGTFWSVPKTWPDTPGQLTNVSIGLAKLLKDNPDASKKRAPRRRTAANGPQQPDRQTRIPFDLRSSRG